MKNKHVLLIYLVLASSLIIFLTKSVIISLIAALVFEFFWIYGSFTFKFLRKESKVAEVIKYDFENQPVLYYIYPIVIICLLFWVFSLDFYDFKLGLFSLFVVVSSDFWITYIQGYKEIEENDN